ncbi:MAG: VWA domain-containing protein [Anaerolineales bacterium]|nr:VWA domain-containing protein [Anaerolineales bacterium]
MKTNDPNNLRFTGVRLFASLLDTGDSIGVILFSTKSEIVTDGIVSVSGFNEKSTVLNNVQFSQADGYTNVKAAFEDVQKVLNPEESNKRKVVLVLLTDGKPEIQETYPTYERETLDLARSLEVPVLAIALTNSAQTPFLEQLALTTNGSLYSAHNAADLTNAFLQVLGNIKDRTVIGGEKYQGSGTIEIEHSLSPYINSVTFIISKPELVDIRFDGPPIHQEIRNSSNDPSYALFTVQDPAGGTYTFETQSKGEIQIWAIIRSRLRVEIVSPPSIHPSDEPLTIVVNLLEETSQGKFTKIIGEVNFTAIITSPDGNTISLDKFYDDGTHGDDRAYDGNYTRTYQDVLQPGIYQISVYGFKGDIPVQASTSTKVMNFPRLLVIAPKSTVEVRGEPIEFDVRLESENTMEGGRIFATIISPSKVVEEFELHGSTIYHGTYLPLEDGMYQITFELRDAIYQGVNFETQIEYSFIASIIPFAHISIENVSVPLVCFSPSNTIQVSLLTNTSHSSTLDFSTSIEWKIINNSIDVKKGKHKFQLTLTASEPLREGIYGLELFITNSDKTEIQPETLIVEFQVPSLWQRCVRPILFGAGFLILVVITSAFTYRMRQTLRPISVTGTLRYHQIGEPPTSATEIDLTIFDKHALLIGSSSLCDVRITPSKLDSEHARITAEKIPEGFEILLEPIGEIQKGYSKQLARFALQHGEIFRMGDYEFQFLSDSGE